MNFTMNSFLGTEQLPTSGQILMKKYLTLSSASVFSINLSSTIMILFIIDHIGYSYTGLITAIMILTQFLTDYPTGSLGDKIGQKNVLLIALLFHLLAFILLTLSISTSLKLEVYLIIGIAFGLGNAFTSGTIESWLDNNYNSLVGPNYDVDRKIYGFSTSRVDSFTIIPSITAFMIGGLLSSLINRIVVFQMRILTILILMIIVFLFMNDSIKFIESSKSNKKLS